ncbi:Ig-like domain-containing protein, partial [Mycobacterium sp. pV006]|uniref:Ig-like domain-containing protein n=1 Tax=Mycobacterium sp. pV006 TaxID=3238983 RepID=UPI00351B6D23
DSAPVTGNVLDNDRDQNVDGTDETLTITPVTSGSTANGGSYTIDEAGNYTYVAAPDFNGEDTFTYDVSDGTTTATGTVTITIAAVNDPITAVDDTNTGTEDGAPVTGNVLDNDRDQNVDGTDETLTVTPVASGTTTHGGSYTIDEAGNYTYVAAPDFNGEDTFTYEVSDGTTTATGTVTIPITAVNDPVVAIDDTTEGVEDGAPVTGNVLDNDRDQNVDGTDEVLTVTPVAGGTTTNGGSYTIDEAGNYTYVAAPDFNGEDSFTYTVSDGVSSSTGTVTISIAAVNDPVVAIDDTNTGTEDGAPVTGNVLTNDRDQNVDGTDEVLTVTPVASGTTTHGGTYSLDAEGNYTYTPGLNFNGIDSFEYTVSDGATTATGTVTISISAVDDPVVAIDDTNTGTEDQGPVSGNVLDNDRDQNVDGQGETLTVTPVAGGTTTNGGAYTIDAAGNYTYVAAPDFNGTDSFEYTVSDGTTTATGTVTITIAAVNDPVVAIDDTAEGVEDGAPVSGNVLDNDRDHNVDGTDEVLTVTPISGSTTNGGTYSIDAEGNYTYTPAENFNGEDTFTYEVSDGATTATGTVTISIAAVNDPITAVDDIAVGVEDAGAVSGNVLENDREQNVDGIDEVLTVTPVVGDTTANGGSYTIDEAGNYTYVAAPDFNGTDSFEYTVSDGTTTATGTVTISITAVNDPVVAIDDTNTGTEDGAPVTGNVLDNDRDQNVDGTDETLTVTPVASGTTTNGGTYSLDTEGNYTYTPAENFNGEDTFTYTVSDGTSSSTGTVTITIAAANDPVVAIDDTAEGVEDGAPVTGNVLTNDRDQNVDGTDEVLTVTPVASGTTTNGGTYTIDEAGNYTYTPAENFNGTDSFEYTVSDGTSSSTGTVTITIAAANDPVVAIDDTAEGVEDGAPVTGNVLDNDRDHNVDGTDEVLTVTPVASGTTTNGGTYSIDAQGNYTYTPAENFNGEDSFTYIVSDGVSSSTGTVTITIAAVNDPVVAIDDTNTGTEDQGPVTGNVLDNDRDQNVDGTDETLTVTPISGTTTNGGTYTIDAEGNYTYTPATNFNGDDTFTYTVSDGASFSTGTVTISIAAIDDPITAVDDIAVGVEDAGAVTGNVLTNDRDQNVDGPDEILVVSPVSGVTANGGSYSIDAHGNYTYTPGLNFNGEDSFTYTVSDGVSSSTGTVTISIAAVNDPVVAIDDTNTGTEDDAPVTGNVLDNDREQNVDGIDEVLTVTPVASGTTTNGGSYTIDEAGNYTYVAAPDFNGEDSFTYTVSDGVSSSTGTVTISIAAANDPVVAIDDTNTGTEDGAPVTGNVLDNDRDQNVDGTDETLTITPVTSGTTANGGSYIIDEAGNYTYVAAPDFNGEDTFTYDVSDGTTTATGTVTITIAAVNDPITAVDDIAVGVEDAGAVSGNVLDNDRDQNVDGTDETLTVTPVASGTTTNGGSYIIDEAGNYTYVAAPDFNGEDSFTYTVSDGVSSSTGTVTISIAAANDPVVAIDDTNTGTEDGAPVTGNVLDNDRDQNVDGPDETLTITPVTSGTTANGGSYTIDEAGNYTYVAAPDFNGEDTFTYDVSDGTTTATGTVTITIAAVNDPITAVDDTNTGTEDGAPVTGNVLDNDRDQNVDGTDETLTVTPVASGTTTHGGSYTIDEAGNYTYVAAPDFNGEDSFTYTVSDGTTSSTGTVTISIAAVDDPVVAIDDTNTGTEDQGPVSGNVLTNDRDQNVDGPDETLTVTPVASGTTTNGGTYTIDAEGNYTYTPATNFNGDDSFTYEVSDGATTATGTVTISIAAVNDPVVAIDDTNTGTEDGAPVTGNVLTNDRDQNVDGTDETLTVTTVVGATTANGGSYTIDEAGNYTYTPAENFNGIDSFEYTVSDGTTSSTGTVTISIAAVDDPVVAIDDTNTGTEDQGPVTGNVLDNDRDQNVDGTDEVLTVTPVASGTTTNGGSYTIDEAGNYTYTPAENFNGDDTFTYAVSDGSSTATGTVTVSITPLDDPITAIDDTAVGVEDAGAVTGNVLTNDREQNVDGQNETLTVTPVAGGTTANGGTYSIDAEGNYTYTPAENFSGTDSFTYTVSDGNTSSTGTVTILIAAVNDPVVAVDDTNTGTEDGVPVTGNVLDNDRDRNVDGTDETLTVTPVVSGTTTNGGTYTIDAEGNYTYTPGLNFNGTDSFEYTVSDGVSSSTGTVTITIAAVNDPVVAIDDTNTGTEDGAPVTGNVLDNDRDQNVDGQNETLTATPVVGGTTTNGGTYSIDAEGNYTYTPAANFNGEDSFTYEVKDGASTSTGTVTIAIAPVNDTPVARNDSYTIDEDTPLVVGGPGLVGNDTDVENDPLTAVLVDGPKNGTLTLNPNGSFTYIPDDNWHGLDSFTYKAVDANGARSEIATVSIAVASINDAPVAVDDSYSVDEDTTLTIAAPNGILANDSDTEGAQLTLNIVTQPAKGSLTLNPNGSFTYTPEANWHGTVSFTYFVNDGTLDSRVATVSITVNSINDAPVANNDAYSMKQGTTLTVGGRGVLGNDTDVEGSNLTARLKSGPSNGSLTLNADGSFTYTPTAGFAGEVTFTYAAFDGTVEGNIATVKITVIENVRPQATDVQTSNGSGSDEGRPDQGDSITFTFSEPIDPQSVLDGWNGTTTDVVVRIYNEGGLDLAPDTLVVYDKTNNRQLSLGTVNLGLGEYIGGLVTGYVHFGASGTPSKMTMSGNTITITFGTYSGSTNGAFVRTVAALRGQMTWTPGTTLTDLNGNLIQPTTASETGSSDREF